VPNRIDYVTAKHALIGMSSASKSPSTKAGLNDRFANTEFKQAVLTGYPSNELATADLLSGNVDAQVQDFDCCNLSRADGYSADSHVAGKCLQPGLRRRPAAPRRSNASRLRQYLD
jgi:hypothetical protein